MIRRHEIVIFSGEFFIDVPKRNLRLTMLPRGETHSVGDRFSFVDPGIRTLTENNHFDIGKMTMVESIEEIVQSGHNLLFSFMHGPPHAVTNFSKRGMRSQKDFIP